MALSTQSMVHSGWRLSPSLAQAGRAQALGRDDAMTAWSGVHADASRAQFRPAATSSELRAAHKPLSTNTSSASSTSQPPPFVASDLENLPDPLSLDFTCGLSCQMVTFVGALPDDGLDAQARVLQFIVDSVRTNGFTSSYYFGGKSLDELRAILQRDRALSDAVRSLYGPDFAEAGISLMLIIRHVCRRPPSNASRKGVQFSEETELIEADDAIDSQSASRSASSLPAFPRFVVDDLRRLPNPFEPDVMSQLVLFAYQRARELSGGPDDDVHLAQFIVESLQCLGLLPNPAVSSIGEATLCACVRQDAAFSESLRALLRDAIPAFVERLFLIIRYVWYSLLH